ncbi:hypothetical protein [Listeria booriae]|uniref:hypothetical protein n=1 Tax=Listeria booriae TaxID=1552123 RepID=UPI0021AD6963|nr:hypothetical protein [Listeria booriae]
MKKLIAIVLGTLLLFSVPVAAHAQKDIVIETTGIFNVKFGSNKRLLRTVPQGAIVNYMGAGKLSFAGTIGYSLLTDRLCPVSSNGWYAAVMKRNVRIPGDQGSASVALNEVVRVKPTVTKKISGVTYIKCAVHNDGWYWNFWVKSSDVARVDNIAYNNIAKFTSL